MKTMALNLSKSKDFDVRMYALALLALLCKDFSEIEEVYESNYFHPNWLSASTNGGSFIHLKKTGKISEEEGKRYP